jgi:DNA-binding transcriptional MerR regulator
MSLYMDADRTYTIMEAASISGLPESTLRYYETIGLIEPIRRDTSSKHRVYSEDDVNIVIAVACLNATGLSIENMRAYLKNRDRGAQAAAEQVTLLTNQKERLEEEAHFMKLRQQYVDTKIAYWKAVGVNDTEQVQSTKERADVLARRLKLPKAITKDK